MRPPFRYADVARRALAWVLGTPPAAPHHRVVPCCWPDANPAPHGRQEESLPARRNLRGDRLELETACLGQQRAAHGGEETRTGDERQRRRNAADARRQRA